MHALNRIILGLLISVLWMHGRMLTPTAPVMGAQCGCTASGGACHCADACACALPTAPRSPDQTPPPASRADWSTAPALASVTLPEPSLTRAAEPAISGPQPQGWQLARRPEPRLCVWRT